jgi:hypothetical protein
LDRGGVGGITVGLPHNFVGNDCEVRDPFIVVFVFFEGLICIGWLGAAGHEHKDGVVGIDVIDVSWYSGVEKSLVIWHDSVWGLSR